MRRHTGDRRRLRPAECVGGAAMFGAFRERPFPGSTCPRREHSFQERHAVRGLGPGSWVSRGSFYRAGRERQRKRARIESGRYKHRRRRSRCPEGDEMQASWRPSRIGAANPDSIPASRHKPGCGCSLGKLVHGERKCPPNKTTGSCVASARPALPPICTRSTQPDLPAAKDYGSERCLDVLLRGAHGFSNTLFGSTSWSRTEQLCREAYCLRASRYFG